MVETTHQETYKRGEEKKENERKENERRFPEKGKERGERPQSGYGFRSDPNPGQSGQYGKTQQPMTGGGVGRTNPNVPIEEEGEEEEEQEKEEP